MNWTAKGFGQIKGSPARLDSVKAAAKAIGGELKSFYMTMGEYDMVAIWEMPDDETYAKFVLRVMSEGNVEGKTLKAFTEEEYRKLLSS
jgi:uncharacterized protein with GYD domain